MSPGLRRPLIAAGGLALFLYGVGVGKYRWWPHDLLHAAVKRIPGERTRDREALEAQRAREAASLEERARVFDPAAAITVRTASDVERRRAELAERIFGPGGLPRARRPDRVEERIAHPDFPPEPPVERIDRLTVEMDSGVRSVAYLFNPAPGRPAVIWHQGHEGDIRYGRGPILRLLREGRSVLAFAMPLLGGNGTPRLAHPRLGAVDLESHDQLSLLPRPLRFFLEPVCAGIGHLADRWGAPGADMVGISGGGWTTTVYAALDPRVRVSAPVAGTLPLALRTAYDWGDMEQHAPDLVEAADYLDLYVLGAAGPGRRQLQVLHGRDSIAFAGTQARRYERAVAEAVAATGAGTWELRLDEEETSHEATGADMDAILERLGR
jgi:pimeloyl-ACP methyl ester carboxylesterase